MKKFQNLPEPRKLLIVGTELTEVVATFAQPALALPHTVEGSTPR